MFWWSHVKEPCLVDFLFLSIVYHGDARAARLHINKVSVGGFPWVYPGDAVVVGRSWNCPGLCVAWATLDASGRSCLVNPLLAELGVLVAIRIQDFGLPGCGLRWGLRVVCGGGLS